MTEENGQTSTITQPAALVSRFIMKMMSLLNTQVAKNWARFDNFFDLLYSFGCSSSTEETEESKAEPNYLGLEFLLS